MECIPQEVFSKIKDKSITCNKIRTQPEDSIICGFYCISTLKTNMTKENATLNFKVKK